MCTPHAYTYIYAMHKYSYRQQYYSKQVQTPHNLFSSLSDLYPLELCKIILKKINVVISSNLVQNNLFLLKLMICDVLFVCFFE